MRELPALRVAIRAGRITYTKAQIIARQATPLDVAERIAAAAETTWEETKRREEKEEAKRDREKGRRRVRGPRKTALLVTEAVWSAKRHFLARGDRISDGEALARVGESYVTRWEKLLKAAEWRTKAEKEIFLAYEGLCAVPGCTRAANHLHHIRFRSEGGPDTSENKLPMCACHHLLGVHRGRLTVRGKSGERLIWKLKDEDLLATELWETGPGGEVRRIRPDDLVPGAATAL